MKFTGKLTHPRLGFLLPAFGVCLIASLWLAVMLRIGDEREELIRLNVVAAAGYAKIFEERTARVLSQIEQFADTVDVVVDHSVDTEAIKRLVQARNTATGDASMRVAVLDHRGLLISGDAPALAISADHHELLLGHDQARGDRLHIGQPYADSVSGAWVIPVTRRLSFTDGSFAGVAVMTIYPAFLTEVFDMQALGQHGSMTLIGSDSVVRARRVGEAVVSQSMRDTRAFFSSARATRDTAVVASPFDGIKRIQSYRRLSGYPLVAVVGISVDEAVAGMSGTRNAYLTFAMAVSLLVVAFVALMIYQNNVLVHSQRRTRILAATLDASGDYVVSIHPDGKVIYANPAAQRLMKIASADEANGTDFNRFFPAWALQRLSDVAKPTAERDGHWIGESAIIGDNGELPLSHMVIARKGPDGVVEYYSNIMRDISDSKRVERALRNSEERLRRVTDRLPMRIAFIDGQERVQLSNAEYEREFGLDADAVKGRTVRELVGAAGYAEIEPYIRRAQQGETVVFDHERNTRAGYFCTRTTYIPECAEDGSVLGFQSIAQDVTAIKLEEQRLLHLSEMDALTGLANRAAFERLLTEAMGRARETGSLLAVMYLDVDYFKRVNDNYGHLVGDALLKDFGKRLVNSVRSFDIVARFGGDEFTILLRDLPHADAAASIAAKIIASMANPFVEEKQHLAVTTSIGVALYRGGPLDAVELLNQADMMLYAAKSGGRNQFCIMPESVQTEGDAVGANTSA